MTKTWIKSLFTFALVLCAGLAWGSGESINIKLNSGSFDADTTYGCYPAKGSAWQVVGGGTTVTDSTLTGSEKVSYKSSATWSMGSSSLSANVLLDAYLDDGAVDGAGTTITVSGLDTTTYATYDVLIYMTGDTTPSTEKHFMAPTVNGVQYTEGGEGSANWGNAGAYGSAPQLGVNCLLVKGQTATEGANTLTISVPGIAQSDRGNGRACISAIQIISTTSKSMSFYVADAGYGTAYTAGYYGWTGAVTHINTWNPLAGTALAPMDNDGKNFASASVVVNGKGGGWSHTAPAQLGGGNRAYRDGQWNLSFKGIPYSEYKIVLFMATDNTGKPWGPVKITSGETETYYSYDESNNLISESVTAESTWGTTGTASGTEGVDVMVIPNLSGDIDLLTHGTSGSDAIRGGLFAFQIINTGSVLSSPEAEVFGEVAASAIQWTVKPGETDSATLTATAAATINLDESLTVATLMTEGAPIEFTGEYALTSGVTVVNADTDVSTITSDLGAVIGTAGKTLTVGLNTAMPESIADVTIGFSGTAENPLQYASEDSSVASWATFVASRVGTYAFSGYVNVSGYSSTDYDATQLDWLRFRANPQTVNIEDGANVTASRLVCSDGNSATTTVNQNGGTLTLTNENYACTGTGLNAMLLGHWSYATTTYNLNAGSVVAEKGGVNLGWDGTAHMTIGQDSGAATALLRAKRLSGAGRNGTASLTIKPTGTLQVGALDLPSNKSFTLAGGKLSLTETATVALQHTDGLNITADSTIEVAADADVTYGGTVKGEARVVKYGAGTLDLSAATMPDTLSFTVNSGALIVPAGKEGAATVAEGAGLTLVLDDTQFSTGYDASGIDGSVSFARLDSEGTLVEITAGVVDNIYTYPTPTWTPVDANSTWDTSGCWSTTTGDAPTSGSIVLNTLKLGEDISVTIPRSFDSITVVGGAEATTTVLLGSTASVPPSLTVMGKVKLPIDTINSVTTLTVSDGAVLIADVASEATLTRELSGNYAFWKDGEGTLTLGANVVANNGCAVQKGVLKLGGNGCWIGAATSYTTAGNVTVAPNATFDLNGTANSFLNTVTLGEGSVLCNNGGEIPTTSRQLRGISLTGNAIVDVKNNFGLLANGHNQTTLTLNGHTLTKTGSGSFWLTNTLAPDGIGGRFRIKEGTLYAYHSGSVLNDIHLSVEGNSTLSLNARLSGLASLKFRAGNGGVNFTGVSNLDAGIRPTLDAAYVDPATLTVGEEVTLIADSAAGLTNGLFSTIAVGGRFSTTNETASAITATVGALTNFWHYSFDGADFTEEALSRAPDSRYAVGGWGDVNGTDKNVNSRNGRAACLYFADNSNRFSAYWNNNTAGVSPFYAGVATITSVVKPRDADKKVIWGLGSGIDANIDCVALVVNDATTMSLVTMSGTPLVTVTGIKNLTQSYHYVTAVFTPDGTTLTVDGITKTSDKVVPSTIDGKGQLGSVHGGLPTGYERQGATGCYLDDWVVYDALLTEGELEALRTTFCPRPFYIRMR